MVARFTTRYRTLCVLLGTMLLYAWASIALWYDTTRDQTESARSSWKRIGASGFNLAVPQGIYEYEVQGIDSEMGAFRNRRIEIHYDRGVHASDLSEWTGKQGSQMEGVEIDGKKGTLAMCVEKDNYVAGIAFRDAFAERDHLTVSAHCADAKAHAVAVEILRSIRFSE